jgi:hypothetical protein
VVLARKKREIIMRKEESDFFQRILIKVVRAINLALKNDEIIAICRLQSGDTLIIFKKAVNVYKTDNI